MSSILGLHFGHDASAALVVDGRVVADVAEERFTRSKHAAEIPFEAVSYCLAAAGLKAADLDVIALAGLEYETEKLFSMLFGHRIRVPAVPPTIRTMVHRAVRARRNRAAGQSPIYMRAQYIKKLPKVIFVEHHLAHAAGAYYSIDSPPETLIATMDGWGDGFSTCLWLGTGGKIEPLLKLGADASIGLFYGNVTEALGWQHGDGEGKTMGLAPYGDPDRCSGVLDPFRPKFAAGELVEPYGPPYITWVTRAGCPHYHAEEAVAINDLVARFGPEDIAAEAQRVIETDVMELVLPWIRKTGVDALATSGGLFLNVKLNQRLWESRQVSQHHPYPNAGDSGLAVGAAFYAAASAGIKPGPVDHLYWGPEFSDAEIEQLLQLRGIDYSRPASITHEVAALLSHDAIVGWFQGRMEAGPRALGNRSILMSPTRAENKNAINARVKFREGFRPFCPSILAEAKDRYLQQARDEPFMITSFNCPNGRRDEIPAVVHVDGTLRPQTVEQEANPLFWELIDAFYKLTGTAVILNTSLNVRGEPIVRSPQEAIRCFFDSGMDALALGNFLLKKPRHPQR